MKVWGFLFIKKLKMNYTGIVFLLVFVCIFVIMIKGRTYNHPFKDRFKDE